MKRLFCLLFVCILNAITFAQSVDDAVYCTEVTYEIKNYKDNWYTPLMYLCQDTKTKEYYHLSNYEDDSDFVEDINNVARGTAIFPENKYFVHDKATDQCIYYNWAWTERGLDWGQLEKEIPEIKTKDEWLEINPEYEPMLERVEN